MPSASTDASISSSRIEVDAAPTCVRLSMMLARSHTRPDAPTSRKSGSSSAANSRDEARTVGCNKRLSRAITLSMQESLVTRSVSRLCRTHRPRLQWSVCRAPVRGSWAKDARGPSCQRTLRGTAATDPRISQAHRVPETPGETSTAQTTRGHPAGWQSSPRPYGRSPACHWSTAGRGSPTRRRTA